MTESLEAQIGRLERLHDMWRGQVEGFEATIKHYKINLPNYLGMAKLEAGLADARAEYESVREQLETAWAERKLICKSAG
jgi:hypothetical protein